MSYTDEQMVIASQIAYMDFLNRDYVSSGSYTIMELLEREARVGSREHRERAQALIERINAGNSTRVCANWRLKDIRNDQHGSGMYACMLETGDEEALIAFRGSESDTLENVVKDWGLSDVGLLNNVLTPQQAAAETYVRDIYKKYGDQYDSFALTGHSLGGNLAEHATITAPDGMRDKISWCVNLDGPGFSHQYLLAHTNDINKSRGLIRHYQWSIIGTLLQPVPGSNYETVQAETPRKSNEIESLLWRHNTPNVVYDEHGNTVPGTKDPLAEGAGPLSKVLDFTIFTAAPGLMLLSFALDKLDTIRDVFETFWERWQEIRNGARDVEFQVRPQTLTTRLEQLGYTTAKLASISEEVEQIRRQLEYNSIAAGYIKLKLWHISNQIESDAGKLEKYCGKGVECGQYYAASENRIVDNYS